VPDKLGGVLMMFGAIAILFVLPWLDTSKVKSGVYRPMFKWFYAIFIANFVLLGWLGLSPAEGLYVIASSLATLFYFAYFLVILPLLGKYEKCLPEPESIDSACKKK
jgi:ubiquinol-cytochrome c reductase cytochrome b subunit